MIHGDDEQAYETGIRDLHHSASVLPQSFTQTHHTSYHEHIIVIKGFRDSRPRIASRCNRSGVEYEKENANSDDRRSLSTNCISDCSWSFHIHHLFIQALSNECR